jgi:hypothetical protein
VTGIAPDHTHRHPELGSGSIGRFALCQRRQTQAYGQVGPMRVKLVDQVDLPLPPPVFQLLFAVDRWLHLAKQLKMHKPINRIPGGEAGHHPIAMLPNARNQVRGHTNVERAIGLARKDVDAGLFIRCVAAKWTLKQVQGDGVT